MGHPDGQTQAAPNQVQIGELARLTGLGKATIEHYLRIGLITPARIGTQGYRLFAPDAVARIQAIRAGRQAGFGLTELRAILSVVRPAELETLLATLPPARCRAELVGRGAAIEP